MKLSIIIPVYNEEATIAQIIARVQNAELPDGIHREIIIINDGSTDQTPDILNSLAGFDVNIIHNKGNEGKTSAVLKGIRAACGDILLIQDADLEYSPEQYVCLLAPILNGESQIVYGSRFLGQINGMEVINRLANHVSNFTVNMLYGARLTDINTCYKVFHRDVLNGIAITGRDFDFDCEITAKVLLKGQRIQEVPITYNARPRWAGKKIRWRTAVAMYIRMIQCRFNPLLC